MGKVKKGRSATKNDDSDLEIEQTAEGTQKQQQAKSTKRAQKSKASKNDVSDVDDDDVAPPKVQEKKKTNKNTVNSSDDEEDVIPVKRVQKSFALLQMDDDDDVDDDESEVHQKQDSDLDSDSGGKPVSKSKSKKKKAVAPKSVDEDSTVQKEQKKGKKSRRKRNNSDEDIDKVLAELEMEYAGIKVETVRDEKVPEEAVSEKKKEKKKKTKEVDAERENDEEGDDGSAVESTMKTAAQKKKEKKEREKQKKKQQKKETTPQQDDTNREGDEVQPKLQEISGEQEIDGQDNEKESKKKKKKGVKEEKDSTEPKKGPGKKALAAMQEALKKMKEDEERMKREAEEKIRLEEEAEQARLEAIRLEQERKERKKQKEKERKERLKAEGKFLTAKQKADRARAQMLIDNMKAQGIDLPDAGEKKPRPYTRLKSNRQQQQKKDESTHEEEEEKMTTTEDDQSPQSKDESPTTEAAPEVEEDNEDDEDVKDAWDASSSSSEEEEKEEQKKGSRDNQKKLTMDDGEVKKMESDSVTESSQDSTSSEEETEEESSEDDDEDVEDDRTVAEKIRERALERIRVRKEEAEKNRTLDDLRAAVICVLGHVDTGKTKILDKLRRTNVQDGEAGGITQQIGATNVPMSAIKEQIRIVRNSNSIELKIPGLLIIDTPGHESFSNLRSRGSSLCDLAILVVDIMHGLEPQTIESINLLKKRKTPFLVALNKIDRLYDWQTMNRKDIRDTLKIQQQNTQFEFEQRVKDVIGQFSEQGLNAALFYENPDVKTYVSLVPTSAISGDGMGNLLALIVEYCQTKLPKRLMYSEELQATVLEVKAIPGLGTTIDVILVNGSLREGDSIVCAGTDGAIVTQIRSLLMPQPMRELRVKNAYVEYKEVKAAQGVKIAAKELEKAIAGLNLYVAYKSDEVDILKEDVNRELKSALSNIKLQERGVYVQASTLGSLEALLEFLKASKIPYSGIRIGPVVKKDVMKASIMLEHDNQYAVILAFDVKVERDAMELADTLGVKIFQADIIYHLFDKFMAHRNELKQRKREEFKNIAVFPCKLKIIPQYVFNSRDPIVVGVMVEAGIVREGTPLCVPTKEFVYIGIVTSIEVNHKTVENARKGTEVCIKIEPVPGEPPKMVGRHFEVTDMLVSKISRQSIDACKDYFRDDLLKTDWQLMVELKKVFQIM